MVRANVEIGKANWRANDHGRARPFFDTAVRAYRGGAVESINALSDVDDTQKALWVLEAKDAASEALFYLAEYTLDTVRAVRFPSYRGGRNLERVNAWSREDFAPWVQHKREAIIAAQTEYERIAELEVPRWEIAAAARIGDMWRSFVDEFRDAPVPDEIANDDELFDIYVGALDEARQPFVQQAKDKFEFCLITSTRVRWFNEFSEECEQELNRLDPHQYPLAAELRGEPHYMNNHAGDPSPVLELGTQGAEEDAEVVGGGDT